VNQPEAIRDKLAKNTSHLLTGLQIPKQILLIYRASDFLISNFAVLEVLS